MLKAKELVKRFGEKTALDGLNTEIGRGCIYGLVGPNGSGKSTLMRLMCGVYRPDGGSITLEDEPIFENVAAKDRILYLGDDLYFPPKATVEDMARFYRGLYSGFSMETYHTLCGCFPLQTDQPLSTFSKRMRRQAALLAALCCHAEYLLLDEAFDGLDPVIRLMVKKLLAEEIAERETTVVISSHNLRELDLRISTLKACEPDQIFNTEIQHIVNKTLQEMPEQSRKIFMLSRYQNLANKQIADSLDISLKTVEAHITKVLRILRLRLKDYLVTILIILIS